MSFLGGEDLSTLIGETNSLGGCLVLSVLVSRCFYLFDGFIVWLFHCLFVCLFICLFGWMFDCSAFYLQAYVHH